MHLPYIILAAIFLAVAHVAALPIDLEAQESVQKPVSPLADIENTELIRSKRGILLAKGLLLGGGLLAGKAALIGGGILGAKAIAGASLLGAGLYHSRGYVGYGGGYGGYGGYGGGYGGGWSAGYRNGGGYGGYGGGYGGYSSW